MVLTIRITGSILFLILLTTLVACENPRKGYIQGILGSGCFWDVVDKEVNVRKATYTYRLLPDGTCYKYRYNYLGLEKQTSVSPVDVTKGEVDVQWRVLNDSVVRIAKEDYKVLKVDKTAVWLESPTTESFMLLKNCKTFITD